MTIRTIPILIVVCMQFSLVAFEEGQIAFIKNDNVFIASADGEDIRRIDNDPRAKQNLRWDASGRRFAYAVKSISRELGRLVVMNLDGRQMAEVPIRPVTDPPTEGLRFPEQISWARDGKIRVEGSINPSKCEMFDLDVMSGKESNWQSGVCGTFAASPDGTHIAARGLMNHFVPEEQRVNSVGLDGVWGQGGGGRSG